MCGQVDTYAIKPKCNQVMNASKTAPKRGGKRATPSRKGRDAKEETGQNANKKFQ